MIALPTNIGEAASAARGLFPCVVKAAPSTPAAASTLVYTISVNLPGGVVEYTNVGLDGNRPPDEYDARPLRVGTAFLGFEMDGRIYFPIAEHFADGPCTQTP